LKEGRHSIVKEPDIFKGEIFEKEVKTFDALVIGRPGGYLAAILFAKMTLLAIIEKAIWGTCLNHGCIPTKRC
jgi:hypothetical protein